MSILTQDEYIKQAAEKYASQKNQKITDSNESYAKESETVRTLYDEKIADTNQLYEDDLRANEVQKFINEREVAENNANLGLTDSGLNRTQQTAVQLSASNNAAKIQRARQSAVDSLTREMTSMLASIESSRAGAERDINDYYEQLASQEGRAIYDTNVQAETARIQAEIEAETARRKNELEAENKRIELNSKGIYGNGIWTHTGTQDEYGNPVWRSSDGKTQSFAKGINPYTGTINKDIQYGANTDNGYQPDNINGTTLKNTGLSTDITGKTQAVWTANGKYYVWYDNLNRYVEKSREELGIKDIYNYGFTQNTQTDPQNSLDFTDWNAGEWEGYFATIRNTESRAAAEEELRYFTSKGLIPTKYVAMAALGARGTYGH